MKPYPTAYIDFLAHFNGTRDYFECHELLEELWKSEQNLSSKAIWHGLIQLAVALYHERRGNRRGAAKMMKQAAEKLSQADLEKVGLDQQHLMLLLEERLVRIMKNEQSILFTDVNLPILDRNLQQQAMEQCACWGYSWFRISPIQEEALIHRHIVRYRSMQVNKHTETKESGHDEDFDS